MSTGRMKDQKDYDFEHLVKVIDTALTSDSPAVQNALRGLLLISTIVSAEHPDQVMRNGPLARVFEDYHNLARRLSQLEDDMNKLKWDNQRKQTEPFMPAVGPYPSTNPWPTQVGTGSPQWPDTWTGTNPNGPKPMWTSTWSAGDDPNYTGAQAVLDSMKQDLAAIKTVINN